MFQFKVMSLPAGSDGVQARDGVTVDWADVDVLEVDVVDVEVPGVEVVRDDDDVEEIKVLNVLDPVVESVVREVSLVPEDTSLVEEETSVVVEIESVVEEEKSVLIVLDETDGEVEDALEVPEVLDDELDTTARLVYTDRRLPAPQYWNRLPLQGLLHSDCGAGTEPAFKTLPQ